jgi:hypothetical protein
VAYVDRQKGTLVLYSNGAIVERNNCPRHVLVVSRRCTCRLVVRIVYADQELARHLFELTAKKMATLV